MERKINKIHADEFEGRDIMWYLEHPVELQLWLENVKDDELTAGRIRTIYVKMKYGSTSAKELADYYDIPEKVVRDIANGELFKSITCDI